MEENKTQEIELSDFERLYIGYASSWMGDSPLLYLTKENQLLLLKQQADFLLTKAKQEAVKDLPKWRDVHTAKESNKKDYTVVGYYLVKNGYGLYLEDLEKLPKENE